EDLPVEFPFQRVKVHQVSHSRLTALLLGDRALRRDGYDQITIPTMLYPQSTYMTSPVTPEARSEHRNAPALPTSSMVTLRFNGAVSCTWSSILRSPEIPAAANVLIGPAEMAFTRIPSTPRSKARKRTLASRLALARPITL